jgi:hypothetical protein
MKFLYVAFGRQLLTLAHNDTPERLWPVAKRSLQAHVDHIRELAA